MVHTGTKAIIIIALFGAFTPIFKITSPPFPSSNPIQTPEPVMESVPSVGNLPSENEEELELFLDIQRRSPSTDQIIWIVIGGLCSSLIVIPISFLYHRYLRDWRNEGGTKHEHDLSQIRMLSQEGERLSVELKSMQVLWKEEENYRHVEFLKVMNLMMNMIKEEEKCCAEVQNDVDSTKSLMTVWSGQLVQFQNSLDAARNIINMERKRRSAFWDEMNTMKTTLDTTLSLRTNRQYAIQHASNSQAR
jgi:hypothetical protein